VTRGLDEIWPSRPVNGPSIAPLLISRPNEQGRFCARGAVLPMLLVGTGRVGPRAGFKGAADSVALHLHPLGQG
jgi:hypothetical protein